MKTETKVKTIEEINDYLTYKSGWFSNLSYRSEERSKNLQAENRTEVNRVYNELLPLCSKLNAEKITFRLAKKLFAYAASHANGASSAITGPSNFPTARIEKWQRAHMNKIDDIDKYRERIKSLKIKMANKDSLDKIYFTEKNAIDKYTRRLAMNEKFRDDVKAQNKIRKKNGEPPIRMAESVSIKIRKDKHNLEVLKQLQDKEDKVYQITDDIKVIFVFRRAMVTIKDTSYTRLNYDEIKEIKRARFHWDRFDKCWAAQISYESKVYIQKLKETKKFNV